MQISGSALQGRQGAGQDEALPAVPALPQFRITVTDARPRGLQVHEGGLFHAAALMPLGVEQPSERRMGHAAPAPVATSAVDAVSLSNEEREALQRSADACRTLAAALEEASDPAPTAPVIDALNVLLRAGLPRKAHIERLLVGFLDEAITQARRELIEAYVNTVAQALPDMVISEARQRRLLLGNAMPVAPSRWAQAANHALAPAGTVPPQHQNAILEPVPLYCGPPLLGRLCSINKDFSARVSDREAMTYIGIADFLNAVLDSPEIELGFKVDVARSEFTSIGRQDRDGVRESTVTAAKVAMRAGQFGAAWAVAFALSGWHEPAVPLHEFSQMEVDPSDLLGQILHRAGHGDTWCREAFESWAPSIRAFVQPLIPPSPLDRSHGG